MEAAKYNHGWGQPEIKVEILGADTDAAGRVLVACAVCVRSWCITSMRMSLLSLAAAAAGCGGCAAAVLIRSPQ